MKHDEFAFFNQQLAAMLKDGIPLEGALRQLCENMRGGHLKREIEALEADLAKGMPLERALRARALPDLYVNMLQAGLRANNLPAVLTLVADHYRRLHSIWTRLTGIMIYPAIVLLAGLAFSIVFAIRLGPLGHDLIKEFDSWGWGQWPSVESISYRVLLPPIIIAVLAVVVVLVAAWPVLRRAFSWHVPPFRWAKLAQTASAMSIMLRGGCTLSEAVGLMQRLEAGSPAEPEFARWQKALAAGSATTAYLYDRRFFPRLFAWLVQNSGEDPASGFEEAARMYEERAAHGVDMLLYGALPVSVLILGAMVASQSVAVMAVLVDLMRAMM